MRVLRQFFLGHQAKQFFWLTVCITLFVKIWIAAFFPMTSDEAFFHEWANHLNYGYYDHPPMIGWWLWLLTSMSHKPFVIRSVSVLLTTVIALLMVYLANRLKICEDEQRIWWAAAIYLSLPVSWFAVFVTTDTPLIVLMTLSIVVYALAIRRDSVAGVVLAGVLLGLFFLSKYFAVILGCALGVHAFTQARRWRYLLALLCGALPFIAINLVYNALNCWNNIMFNLVNRHDDARLNGFTVLGYLAMLIYVLTPWVIVVIVRGFCKQRLKQNHVALWLLVAVPLMVFLLISFTKTVGLHWVLGFIPLVFVLLCNLTHSEQLKRLWYFNTIWSLPHLFIFAVLIHAPAASIQSVLQRFGIQAQQAEEFKIDIHFHRNMPAILNDLKTQMPPGSLLTTTAYSPAALMSYHYGQVVPVFGPGSYHARNDDVFVNWREHDQQTVWIVSKIKPIDVSSHAQFFSTYQVFFRTIHGVPFWIFQGEHFNYAQFRQVHLQTAVNRYYQIPHGLPILGCPFAEKYGFQEQCRVGDLGIFERFR